jgi:hypothetical protein
MKKLLLKISLAAIAAISVNAQVINLDQGWTNVGIINDTSIADFNDSHIQYMWQYRNGQWNVYSPNNEIMESIRHSIENGAVPYGIMPSMLPSGSAVWILSNESTRLRVGEEAAYTSVNGVVKDALTNELIPNFTLVLDGSNEYRFTDNNGTFNINNIPLGEHTLTVHADGYRDLNMSLDIETTTPLNLGQLQLIPDQAVADINVTGRVMDAVTGNPIEGARLRMYPGYNNQSGEPIVDMVLEDGTYNVEIPAGPYTVVIDANGYYSTRYNYTFVAENDEDTISQDFALAPEQTGSHNEILRAVLTWGENPRDLDSHLVAIDEDHNQTVWHVYYGHKNVEYNGTVIANLDRDDTTSYGPETTTLMDLNTSLKYKYFVHKYAGEGDLKDSNAHLVVYYNGREYEFQVPNEEGTIWKVFEIDHGVLVPCVQNCMFTGWYTDTNLILNMRETNDEDGKSVLEILNSDKNNPK